MPNAVTRIQHAQDTVQWTLSAMLHVTKTALHDVTPPHYIPKDAKSSIVAVGICTRLFAIQASESTAKAINSTIHSALPTQWGRKPQFINHV